MARLVMGILVRTPSSPGGAVIQALEDNEPRPPHSRCDPRSWCQPVDVSQAAQKKADLRARSLV